MSEEAFSRIKRFACILLVMAVTVMHGQAGQRQLVYACRVEGISPAKDLFCLQLHVLVLEALHARDAPNRHSSDVPHLMVHAVPTYETESSRKESMPTAYKTDAIFTPPGTKPVHVFILCDAQYPGICRDQLLQEVIAKAE